MRRLAQRFVTPSRRGALCGITNVNAAAANSRFKTLLVRGTDRKGHEIMASEEDIDSAVSLVLAELRSMGCELRSDLVKRLRRVIAEHPERRERARQSMANGGRKGFQTRRSKE